jgi:hypothetical protein
MLAAMLALGLIAALLVRPVAAHWWQDAPDAAAAAAGTAAPARARWGLRLAGWSAVLLPLAWGAWFTLQKAVLLI